MFSATEWADATAGGLSAAARLQPLPLRLRFEYPMVDFDADSIESLRLLRREPLTCSATAPSASPIRPGHSAGHTSVILRLPRRDFVVGRRPAYNFRQFVGGAEPRPWSTSTTGAAR